MPGDAQKVAELASSGDQGDVRGHRATVRGRGWRADSAPRLRQPDLLELQNGWGWGWCDSAVRRRDGRRAGARSSSRTDRGGPTCRLDEISWRRKGSSAPGCPEGMGQTTVSSSTASPPNRRGRRSRCEREYPLLSYQEVNRVLRESLKRRLVVVGACTGTDAHTVGLDAILSMKGFAGDHGLEHFPEMRVVNMGAQVSPSEIVTAVEAERADAVLVSQVVTQRDAHIHHLGEVETRSMSGYEDRWPRRRGSLIPSMPRPRTTHLVRNTKPSELRLTSLCGSAGRTGG